MALAVVQSVIASGSSVSSITTAGINTTSGNLLVADCASFNGEHNSVTDNNTLTWSVGRAQIVGSGGSGRSSQRYSGNISGRSGHTFTLNLDISDFPEIVVTEISGAATSSPLDVSADGESPSSSTNFSTNNTASTAQADEIACGSATYSSGGGSNYSIAGGYILSQTNPTGSQQGIIAGYKILSATGVQAFSMTNIQSGIFVGVVATYKAAAAPVTNAPKRRLLGVGR